MNILDFSDYVIFIRGFDDIHASSTIVRLPLDRYDSATFSSMAKNGLKHILQHHFDSFFLSSKTNQVII